jgi:1,4-alpha-glucan branching enzyme
MDEHNNNHEYAMNEGPPMVPVSFAFTHSTAAAVCLAGTFNDWRPEANPMHFVGGGRWRTETVLPPGTYEYRLVVDSHWIADPLARETVPNPFGGRNSLLTVPNSLNAAHPADAGNGPLKHANKKNTQKL